MKKPIMMLLAAGLFTFASCESAETTEERTEEVGEGIEEGAEEVGEGIEEGAEEIER